MNYVNYQALVNVMRTQKPYRNSTNRFPYANRKHSRKYFLHEHDENGELMRLIYGQRYSHVKVTEDEYKENPTHIHKYESAGEVSYMKYIVVPNELGVIRPDNSFEFTQHSYSQGDKMQMTDLSHRALVMSESKLGGMIIGSPYIPAYNWRSNLKYMVPVFQGLKIDCSTLAPDPSRKYQLFGQRIDRKISKEFISQYETFFKVSKAMMSSIDMNMFVDIAKESVKNVIGGRVLDRWWFNDEEKPKILKAATEMMNDSPLDAAALFCVGLGYRGIHDFWWRIRNFGGNTLESVSVSDMYESMKKSVYTMLYKENPEVFKNEEFEFGKVYPQSSWGYTIVVDGEVKHQCG